MEKVSKALGTALMAIAGTLLLIPLRAIIGLAVGWLIKMFVGAQITAGLNLLFDTSRFMPEHLPIIFATLSACSGYLKTTVEHKEKE